MPPQSNDLLANLLGSRHVIVLDRPQMFGLWHCRAPLQQSCRFCTRCPLSPSRTRPAQSNSKGFVHSMRCLLVEGRSRVVALFQGNPMGLPLHRTRRMCAPVMWSDVVFTSRVCRLRTDQIPGTSACPQSKQIPRSLSRRWCGLRLHVFSPSI